MTEPLKGSRLIQPLDNRNLRFENYIDHTTLHDVPVAANFAEKKRTPWRRMGNWTANDCTCATAGHMIECWTANATHEDIILTREVMEVYIALSGYNPETHQNDDGLCYSDVLKYWRKNGIGNHKIRAYTTVNFKDPKFVRAAVYAFGGAYVGLNLPNTIIHQELWDVKPGGLTGDRAIGSFGGHAVNIVAYDENFIYVVSWGKVKRLTWEFLNTYGYVFYAVISEDFFNAGHTPFGLELNALETDLMAISKSKKTLEKQLTTNIDQLLTPNNMSTTNEKNSESSKLPAKKSGGKASKSGKIGGHGGGKGGKSGKTGGSAGTKGGASGASAG